MSDSIEAPASTLHFRDLNLSEPLLKALADVGYESPSPIQAATLPPLLEGRDVLGQAQTGTGKTAAFALPILNRLDMRQNTPQALVLAPTRELAIQVAEAFQRYATHLPNFRVLPIYGGQSYGPQLSGLKRGAHVVVGTPGRIIDHLNRGSLILSELKTLVLDEADEMLRMGFIDDVESILSKTPAERQIALFSATMPAQIRRIAENHLKDPVQVTIKASTTNTPNITQRYWYVSGMHKLDALTRILEAETFDAMIVFSRTKLGTEELANKLQARGFSAAAINGDMQQAQRERTIGQLKDGTLDILCATDVAARGLDVERISHVINYDIPHDVEGYVHRIGRTGRAGRSGEAILFVTPREKRLLQTIERATKQKIEEMTLPSVDVVNDKRVSKFKQRISETLSTGDLGMFQSLIDSFEQEHNVPAREIAAALARMVQGDSPLLLQPPKRGDRYETEERPARGDRYERTARPERSERAPRFDRAASSERPERPERPARAERSRAPSHESTTFEGDTRRPPRREERAHTPEAGFETFRVEVGHDHGVKPGNIVGAIANEAGLDSKNIGRIDIRDDHSLIDLPEGMPSEIFRHLKKVWVSGQQLQIAPNRGGSESSAPPRAAARPSPRGKPPAPAGDRGFDKPESGFAKPRRPRTPE